MQLALRLRSKDLAQAKSFLTGKEDLCVKPQTRQDITTTERRVLCLVVLLILGIFGMLYGVFNDREGGQPLTATELDSRGMEASRQELFRARWEEKKFGPEDTLVDEAHQAVANKRYDEAIKLADKVIKNNINHAGAYLARGRAWYGKGNVRQALADYSQAILLSPETPDFYVYRGQAFRSEKLTNKALADYTKAVEINPDYAVGYYHRGDIYLDQKEYAAALAEYTKAINKQAGLAVPLPTPYYKRGYVYYQQKEYQAAIRDFNRALELAPEMYECYLYRANSFTATRRYGQAMKDYDYLIRIKPDFALGYYGRALILEERGEPDRAREDFRKAEQLGIKRTM